MGLINWFTSGGKQVERLTESVIASGDALIYTEEEKAKTAERQRELYFKFLELSRDENSIKSITRRILAFGIIGQWLLLISITVGLQLYGIFTPDTALAIELKAGAVFVGNVVSDTFWLTAAVVGFYFGAHFLPRVKRGG